VTDLARAKGFYGETLGLLFLWENPASVRFRCGDSSELSIFKRPPTATEHTLAHFEVTDIEAAVRDLEAKGVDVELEDRLLTMVTFTPTSSSTETGSSTITLALRVG
jgi:Glyoxalase/Bleomycin resistance protein/Dioxygenase superfamily.